MEGRLKLGHISEAPRIEVIKDSLIFGSSKGVFVEESVGGRVDVIGNTKRVSYTLTKLGFAGTKIALEGEDKGEAAGEIEVAES